MVDWNRDRIRQLKKRAIAEDIDDQQKLLAAQSRTPPSHPSKVSLRAIGEEMVQQHEKNQRGSWTIICDSCGHQGRVEIELSIAQNKALKCTQCDHRQWLTEEDLKPPWD